MSKAHEMTYTGRTDTSESLSPRGSFQVQAIGTYDTGVSFAVEQLPINEADSSTEWTPASGNPTTLSGNVKLVSINYAYGFKYRLSKTGTQNSDIKFYTGHLVQNDYLNVSNRFV